MSETVVIYYHKPKIRRTNIRREAMLAAGYSVNRLNDENALKVPERAERAASGASVLPPQGTVLKESMFNYAANTLRSLGLTGKYDGFIYICRAIEEILKEKEPPHFQSIYYDIGKEFDVNRCSVERSIRYAIGYIRRNGNASKLSAIFGEAVVDEKNFSNSKFLTILAADVYEKLTTLEVDA